MVVTEIISSLSHCAQHRSGRLYGCQDFLQAWLHEHMTTLSPFPTYASLYIDLVQSHVNTHPLPAKQR